MIITKPADFFERKGLAGLLFNLILNLILETNHEKRKPIWLSPKNWFPKFTDLGSYVIKRTDNIP